ncbi:LLM class flavin-dependent oxidoreductase [Pyxidicoccus xibeiensis]|uniref:LLM class flavin-dependent oxidoreductase n=1 Tax=Pyxidicoccus xibeiensis TaxID=2906759 RepID=UPI0020A8331F|nr:LLM class flavin-dependent oxidoreductase [Pyxidicoccus xibeiensis]MCP3139271.1 LLM class flavin-dependent oxidoreductase [Pyxidicoccus xibeiensis]
MNLPLSVLDLAPIGSGATSTQALRDSLRLAQHVERLGYHRLWYAEHHGMPGIASSAPDLLIAHAAQLTSRLRLGSGGVMLPNHAPLAVAERFGILESLHPGRIDLGIGRAPGGDARTAHALRKDPRAVEDFTSDVRELIDLLSGRTPTDQPFGAMPAVPRAEGVPEVWLLGSSGFSAQLAGVLGLPFSFAHHFSPQNTLPAVKLYRERFAQAGHAHAPRVLLAVGVVAADTQERATEVASSLALSWVRIHTGKTGPIPSPEEARRHPWTDTERAIADSFLSTQVIGDAAAVHDGLTRLARATGADELMLSTMAHRVEDRMRSYELVAETFGLATDLRASAR